MNADRLMREFWHVWREEGVERLLARYEDFFTEDAVWSPPIAQVAGQDFVGRAGFADYVREFNDAFKSFGGSIETIENVGPGESVGSDLYRSSVRVSAELAAGGRLDGSLVAIVRMRGGRMAYGWGSYDPEAAERKLDELRTERADA